MILFRYIAHCRPPEPRRRPTHNPIGALVFSSINDTGIEIAVEVNRPALSRSTVQTGPWTVRYRYRWQPKPDRCYHRQLLLAR